MSGNNKGSTGSGRVGGDGSEETQAVLGDATFTQNSHEDELTLIFDKLYVFREGVLQNIRTVTERVDNIDASTLTGFTD